MNNLREAAQAALDALEQLQGGCTDHDDGTVEVITVWCPELIDDLRAALAAEPAQPLCYLKRTSFSENPPHGWAVHFTDGEVPLYAAPQPPADAIREAVLAEREAIIQACEDELFSEETTPFTKGYNGGIRNCLIVIKARGAA